MPEATVEMVDKPLWMWGMFIVIVAVLLVFDLGVLHRKDKAISLRSSLWLSGFYISIGLAFGGWVWHYLGAESGKEYLTGYLVEKTLSMDNIFMMSVLFGYFAVPRQYHHRVLFWGILGVIVLRGIMIGAGAVIVASFHWVLYIFAAFLIIMGVKMFFTHDTGEKDIADNRLLKFLRNHLPVTDDYHGKRFWVMLPHAQNPKKKVRYYTPLFLALVLIEFTDLIFALDSIPAIFAITTDPYVVYTSNIFAILGLRALYFALSAVIYRFHYLQYALSLILVFIGAKVFVPLVMDIEKVPASVSLSVTVALLLGGIIVSLVKTKDEKPPQM